MSVSIYMAVVIERTPDAFLVKCGRCGGSGENNREYECHVCRGGGKVLLRVPADWANRDLGILKCGRCGATGEKNREYFCKVCNGVGAIVKCFPRAPVPGATERARITESTSAHHVTPAEAAGWEICPRTEKTG